ncbi:MAG: hypothetical protein HYZ15_00995 [Sphingobacteriales bacterium]|nr:hypothetical protein [Sphingobacteriales bacterium]
MPDIFSLIKNWWKQTLLLLLLSLVTTGVIVYTKRPEYLSVATAVPASTYTSDKARLFNSNIEQLYTALGTPDDLDLVVGTGKLDTVYLAVTAQFNLQDHYKTGEKGEAAIGKAASLLKKNSSVTKSEYGELKVRVWDTDKNLAPQLANAVMNQLQFMHQGLRNAGNEATLGSLITGRKRLQQQMDSVPADATAAMMTRLAGYDKLIDEYQLIVDNRAPALVVVENARTSDWPDRPKRVQWMLATAVLALLFSLLLAALLEKRKSAIG